MEKLLKMFGVPMFGILGDEDSGGDGSEDSADSTDENSQDSSENDGTPPDQENDRVADSTEDSLDEYDWQKDFETKGPEGLAKEARRKALKIQKLEAEMAELRKKSEPVAKTDETKPEVKDKTIDDKGFKPFERITNLYPQTKTIVAELRADGMPQKMIEHLVNLMAYTGVDITGEFVNPISKRFVDSDFKEAVDTFSKDDKYKFVMSKPEIRKEVEAYVKKTFPKDMLNPQNIRIAYLEVKELHPELSAKKDREIIDGSPHENSGDNKSEVSGDYVSWAKRQGMDVDTKENKEIAKKAYMAYKSTIK